MSMLDRKLLRDLAHLWMPILAIALVMACGAATLIMAIGAYRSLDETRATFYDRYGFATVFASATRAPISLKDQIAHIPGVAGVALRIVRPVILDMEGMAEAGTGIIVSIPDQGEADVNRLYLRSGRLPDATRKDEVAVTETFATAHRLVPGNSFTVIMNGKKRRLTITGIVLSPEYIYAIGPGQLVPDNRHFGVMFMPRSELAGVFDMKDAFDNLALTTQRNANIPDIIDRVDALLKPYGGTGAYGRKDQISHAFLDSELQGLRAMALVVPPIFLLVSAFLVNMVLTRMIALQREQIGLLKAVGYSNVAIGWHYAKFIIAVAIIGLIIGSAFGAWLGRGITRIYAEFYSFPFLIFRQSVDLYLIAGGISVAAALAGGTRAIASVLALPAAVAMRAPSPTRYRNLFAAGSILLRPFSQLTIMALRHLFRWPARTAMTVLGTSLSVGLMVASLFSFASSDFMVDTIYFRAERQDATVYFTNDRPVSVSEALAHLPGVMRVETFRAAPVVLHHGHYERRLTIDGVARHSDLSQILDVDLNAVTAPSGGLLLTERVAKLLHARVGDLLEVELLDKRNRIVNVPVTAIAQSYIGLGVYMRNDALNRLMGDGNRVSGARLAVDSARLNDFYRAVKATPVVAGTSLLNLSRENFRKTINDNIAIMMTIYVGLAVIITFGVIYNSARIQLAERARELAGLRVMGFTRTEVSRVLFVELAIIVFLAQPIGWLIGWGLAWAIAKGLASDLYRFPMIVTSANYATSSLVVLVAAVLSGLIVRRRIDRLDLIRVLKTRD